MDNQRVFIWAALALVLWLNYTTWQRDYAPQAAPVTDSQATAATQNDAARGIAPRVAFRYVELAGAAAKAAPTPEQAVETADTHAGSVRVVTDVLRLDISKRGGDLERADLLKYPKVKNHPELPVRLFNPENPRYVARSGLRAPDKRPEPTHLALFRAAADEYRLKPGEAKLDRAAHLDRQHGVTVTKTYTF